MNKWYKENSVFVLTLVFVLCVIVFDVVYNITLGEIARQFMSWVSYYFGWLYILSIVAFIGFYVWMAVGKWGHLFVLEENL